MVASMFKNMKVAKHCKIYFIVSSVILMIGCGYTSGRDKSPVPSAPIADNGVHYKVEFSPSVSTTKLIIDTINSADKSIYVAAYCLTSTPIADNLIKAHLRGIDVKVILDKTQAAHRSSKYYYLLSNSVPVRINNKYKAMHNKFMVIDNAIVETGSFNYTDNAEQNNAENILIIYQNTKLAQQYIDVWQKLWKESK